jgi:hypothetical protein
MRALCRQAIFFAFKFFIHEGYSDFANLQKNMKWITEVGESITQIASLTNSVMDTVPPTNNVKIAAHFARLDRLSEQWEGSQATLVGRVQETVKK